MSFNVKEHLESAKRSYLETIDIHLDSLIKHKFQGHERLFRLTLNLNTLALTAWVGLVTWKADTFEIKRSKVLIACSIHIASLLLMAVSDLCIMLQSKYLEGTLYDLRQKHLAAFAKAEGRLLGLTMADLADDTMLSQEASRIIQEHYKEDPIDAELKKQETADFYSKSSWIIGILGLAVFFVAIFTSIFYMTQYIGASKVAVVDVKPTTVNQIQNNNTLVPAELDEKAVLKIAEKKLVESYGESILKEKPFQASLNKNIWTVSGTLHCLQGSVCKGGVATIHISTKDGSVIDIMHGK